jgi:RNA polymerase sigma-70 factor (ECF subfamily)
MTLAHDTPTATLDDVSPLQETDLLAALRRGDEAAFVGLVERYHATMMRLALLYVSSYAVAEEVVQETWMEVFRGLERFEGRAALRTWMFRILTNVAKTRGQREARTVCFSSLGALDDEPAEPAVAPERFRASEPWAGNWACAPRSWDAVPEAQFLSEETRAYIGEAVAALSAGQREVITLRDIEGWTAEEVCAVLGISQANQRVLLHRARSRVRGALERYFENVVAPE